MKKYLSKVVLVALFICSNIGLLEAEDLTPSESYYKSNIAVNEISTESPTLKSGTGDDSGLPNPEGEGEGGGGQVNAPIGDAVIPLLVAGLLYGSFILFRKRETSND